MESSSPIYVWSRVTDDIGRHAPPRTEEYMDRRMQLYFRFCLPAILRQTMPATPWLSAAPGTERELQKYLPMLGEAGVFVTFDRGQAEAKRLAAAGVRIAYTVACDSDDAYAPTAVESLVNALGETVHSPTLGPTSAKSASIVRGGYVHYLQDGSFYEFNYPSPPFYLQKRIVYGRKFVPEWDGQPHGFFRDVMNPGLVEERLFCILSHGGNVCAPDYHRTYRGKVPIEGERRRTLLRLFGLDGGGFWASRDTPAIHAFLAGQVEGAC